MSEGTRLTLKAGQEVDGLKLSLTPQAVVSGRVVDQDGDPVEDVFVQLLPAHARHRNDVLGSSGTDDAGVFRISGVAPGRYALVANVEAHRQEQLRPPPGKPDVRMVRTYYPDADTLDSASPLNIAAGQEYNGIELRMHREAVYHIMGRLVAADQKSIAGVPIMAIRKGDFEFHAPSFTGKDGSFDIAGVTPGEYIVQTFGMWGPQKGFAARQVVTVGSTDVKNVIVHEVPFGTISGQVHTTGAAAGAPAPDLTNIHVFLRPADQNVAYINAFTAVAADGSFKLERVQADDYYVSIGGEPEGSYIASVRFRGQDITGKALDVTQSVAGDLEITLGMNGAKISGTVQASGDQPTNDQPGTVRPSQSVLLIPDTLNDDGTGLIWSDCDQSGAFTVKAVRPGHYRAVATKELTPDLRDDQDLLRALAEKGADVQISEGETKQLQLNLLADSDMQQAKAKAAIEE